MRIDRGVLPIVFYLALSSCSSQKDILPSHRSGPNSFVSNQYKDQYFVGGHIRKVEFMTSDSAIIYLRNGLEHRGIHLAGYGWVIGIGDTYYGVHEIPFTKDKTDFTMWMVIAKNKSEFLTKDLKSGPIIFSENPRVPLGCDDSEDVSNCFNVMIETEICGLIGLDGRNYMAENKIK